MTDQPPGNYPPPPPGGYPPPPAGGGYPPLPQQGGQPGYPPPPPQFGYPPPPQFGYPPSQFGYPPSGPPGGGFKAPYSVGEAFSWAWDKFNKNAGPLILATLVFGVMLVALNILVQFVAVALSPIEYTSVSSDYGFSFAMSADISGMGWVALIIGGILLVIAGAWVQSAYLGGALRVANGEPVTLNSFFHARNVANVVFAGLLIGIAVSLAYFVCLLPGLLVGSGALIMLGFAVGFLVALAASILLMFTIVALLDRDLSPIDAIKTSYGLVRANFVSVFLTGLVIIALAFAGSLLCFVGLLVTYPLSALITVYAYRRLTGGQVAPRTF